jgi:hypothetical protein
MLWWWWVGEGSSRRVGPVLQLARSRPIVGRSDTSCRDPETSQRQRLGAHEPCWPQVLLSFWRQLSWSRHDGLALPLPPLHVPHPPSQCSSCPPSMPPLPLSQPTGPTSQGVHVPLPTALLQASVGWLCHEARPQHYSLALQGREGVASACSKPW